jgi:hypothetical protein
MSRTQSQSSWSSGDAGTSLVWRSSRGTLPTINSGQNWFSSNSNKLNRSDQSPVNGRRSTSPVVVSERRHSEPLPVVPADITQPDEERISTSPGPTDREGSKSVMELQSILTSTNREIDFSKDICDQHVAAEPAGECSDVPAPGDEIIHSLSDGEEPVTQKQHYQVSPPVPPPSWQALPISANKSFTVPRTPPRARLSPLNSSSPEIEDGADLSRTVPTYESRTAEFEKGRIPSTKVPFVPITKAPEHLPPPKKAWRTPRPQSGGDNALARYLESDCGDIGALDALLGKSPESTKKVHRRLGSVLGIEVPPAAEEPKEEVKLPELHAGREKLPELTQAGKRFAVIDKNAHNTMRSTLSCTAETKLPSVTGPSRTYLDPKKNRMRLLDSTLWTVR